MTLLALGFPMTAAAAPQRDSAATVAKDSKVISMAEFRKLLAEPVTINSGCGTTCDYKSPYYWVYWCGSGCEDNWRCADDAYTVDEDGSGPNLEYRYSPSCRTGWARSGGCYDQGGNLIAGLGNFSYYNQNSKRAETWGPVASGSCYTRMLSIGGMWGLVAYQYGPGTSYSDWVYGS
jgi:hypothetical protein